MSNNQQSINIKKYISINKNWKFKEDSKLEIEDINFTIYKEFDTVDLPHDWSIYKDFNNKSLARNEGGLLDGGIAWYIKEINVSDEFVNKEIFIKFGGIYMDSSVFINGSLVGNYPSGYTSFVYDITNHLKYGKNIIAVKVKNIQSSSRWYSGSGIYRNVDLILKEKLYFEEFSTTIRTPNLNKNLKLAPVEIEYEIKNKFKTSKDIEIVTEIVDHKGKSVASSSLVQEIPANKSVQIIENLEVKKPRLWSVNEPNLYYVKSSIKYNGEIIDGQINRFGFRYYNWSKNGGFSLNGEYIKFHGVCLHHDNGALGAELNIEADRRKLEIMKNMGVNAIRTSHNPQSEEFIRLCDEMGFLVQEEAFDTWHGDRKKDFDYNRFFNKLSTHPNARLDETWAEFDIKSMIKRDINSPSIIMWSIGNEIFETEKSYGFDQAKNLIKWIKEIDTTRYVTIAENSFNWNIDKDAYHVRIANMLDVVGLNYNESGSDELHEKYNWKLYGAETSSAVRSRGIYYNPSEVSSIATGNSNKTDRKYQMSDYGNDRVGWGATAIDSWIHDRDRKYYAGQFIWTGFDYIGEPTPWHNEENLGAPVKSSFFGIVDTCGFPKNDYYFYQSQWLDKSEKKVCKILPHWNFEDKNLLKSRGSDLKREDNIVPVRVYSNLENVELFLNDKSLGKKSFNKQKTDYGMAYFEGKTPRELYLEWMVEFEKGELKAIAFDDEGNISEDIVNTAEKAHTISLKTYNKIHYKNELAFLKFDIVDKFGNIVPTADNKIEFSIENGEIIGVDNGNPASQERYKIDKNGKWLRRAFSGSGLVIIKLSDKEKTKIFTKSVNDEEYLEDRKLVINVYDRETHHIEDRLKSDLQNYNIFDKRLKNLKSDLDLVNYLEDIKISTTATSGDSISDLLPSKVKIKNKDESYNYVDVDWIVDNSIELNKLGRYEIKGVIKEGFDVNAIITVHDFVSVENFSMAIREGNINPILPDKARVYSTSGEIREKEIINWLDVDTNKKVDFSKLKQNSIVKLKSKIVDSNFYSYLNIRIVEKNDTSIVDSYNFARVWNGSELPAGIASFTSDLDNTMDSTVALNNEIIAYEQDYMDRWSNLSKDKRSKDWAGILFGRAGEFSKHQINKLEIVFFEDEYVSAPKEYKIEYYVPDEISIPSDYSNISKLDHELNRDENWKEIKDYSHYKGHNDKFNIFEFKDTFTHAIRINMLAKDDRALGITEIKAFGKDVKANDNFDITIDINNKKMDIIDDKTIYEVDKNIKKIEVESSNNAAVTIIPGVTKEDDINISVKSEDKFVEKLYKIRRKND